ncbi:MAG TPA: hypothetical protein VK541_13085, partial [Pedobacter sp.]|uniref:hypothetical protein n=1 Tax=Pedobacter sp. TaxID=1411316 RepID=UPI002B54AFC6
WGAAVNDVATGLHKDLVLTCITFRSETEAQPLILIAMDLGWWKNMDDERFFRQPILEALEIEASGLMICFSHTHAGPGICRSDAVKAGGNHIEPYLLQLQKKAIETARIALGDARPAVLTWKYGTCSLAANRDLPEKGKDRIVVGFNPDMKADDIVLVGRITDGKGRITGTLVNYACHPTTLAWDNLLISPDYVGAMREMIQTETHAPCLFLQGASGELAPAEQYSGDTELADRHGRQLGFSVLSALQAMLPPAQALGFDKVVESGAPLAIWKPAAVKVSTAIWARMIDVPLPLKELPSLAEIEKEWEECRDHVLKERLSRKLNVRKVVGEGKVTAMPLWVWQLGSSFLIGQPNEAYSAFQQELRTRFPGSALAVMNVVNGHIGYLPNKELYAQDIYSVWQSPFAEGGLETLIRFAGDAVESINRENKDR